jgi:hypothetical protein
MSRAHDEGKLAAMRCYYQDRLRNAPPEEAERIKAHMAALELSLPFPHRAALFQFLAIKHPRTFSAFARRLANPAGFR